MTTNAGSTAMNTTGFNRSEKELESEKTTKALLTFLRPEFINRIDEIITFSALGEDTVKSIADIMLSDLKDSLKLRDIELVYDQKCIEFIANNGFETKFGARSLKRFIQKQVEDKIAGILIENFKTDFTKMYCTADDSGIVITY
jgi:ATP-dependent Clp protease ATP-binding subunit ClpB